jgi:hypothetical protein
MKDENKFLSRSRDRERWKKKLKIQPKKEAKAGAIYFRPTLSDDRRIRELAEITGETKNSVVEKLVSCALYNKSFTTSKLDEQNKDLRRLEDKTDDVADVQLEVFRLLEEIRREQRAVNTVQTSLLGEIYCMAHTAVSLIRTALLQILGLARENAPPSSQVLDSFDETSDLTIERSLEDLEKAFSHHQIKNENFTGGNLFWKSKLSRADSPGETD